MKFTDKDVRALAHAIRQAPQRTDFLIGAGMSKSAGLPLARELVAQIKESYPYDIDRLQPEKQGDYGACMGALTTQERKELLFPYLSNAKINWAHIALASMLQQQHVRRVLTFNFDNVLARACGLLGLYPATYDFGISPASDVEFISDPAIVHLHGQGYGPVMMNSDEETHEHAAKLEPLINDCLEHSNLIVVGYSGEADQVFPTIAQRYRGTRRLFWIGRSDEPPPHLNQLIHGRHQKYCQYIGGTDADTFMIQLAQELNCFPPGVFDDPASHLLTELQDIIGFPLSGTVMKVDILEEVRERLKNDGHILRLSQTRISALAGKTEDIVLKSLMNTTEDIASTDNEFEAWAYFSAGLQAESDSNTENREELLQKAIQEYEKAISLKPDFAEALNNLGNVMGDLAELRQDENLFLKALESYQRSLEIDPRDSVTLYNLANTLESFGSLKKDKTLLFEACEKYEAALLLKPDYTDALHNWGITLGNLGALTNEPQYYEKAFARFEDAHRMNPRDADILSEWGTYLVKSAKANNDETRFYDAFEKFSSALSIDENSAEVWGNWGWALALLAGQKKKQELFEEAFRKYERSLAVNRHYETTISNWQLALNKYQKLFDEVDFGREQERYKKALLSGDALQ